jgi:hypothetical protein
MQKNYEKLKFIVTIVLTATLAFGLGYLIRGEVKKSPIIIEKAPLDIFMAGLLR